MTKPIEVKHTIVQCDEDECNFEQDTLFSEIPSWHNVTCPDCGKAIIINDKEMEMWTAFTNAMNLINESGVSEEHRGPLVELQIDTSKLR
jgi:hypothetical protein